jgi:hypothetical protein
MPKRQGELIDDLEEGRFRGIASELTLLELTVRPLQLGRQEVADDYEILLSYFPNLDLEPVSREILLDAAGLRPGTGLGHRTPFCLPRDCEWAPRLRLPTTTHGAPFRIWTQ